MLSSASLLLCVVAAFFALGFLVEVLFLLNHASPAALSSATLWLRHPLHHQSATSSPALHSATEIQQPTEGRHIAANYSLEQTYASRLRRHRVDANASLPEIVKSFRAGLLDWHLLLPPHKSLWERFGVTTGESKCGISS